MRVDTNTNGHMQWFYFSVKNNQKEKVRFNIYRFRKRYSLYQRGMRPYVKSIKSGNDWAPAGQNIKYLQQRQNNQHGLKSTTKYYYLQFQYIFEYQNDQVFFAAGIPYTTTFLSSQIKRYQQCALKRSKIRFEVNQLCLSVCGQQIEVINIGPRFEMKNLVKNYIIINCRSHSGQISGSWVLDGILDILSSSSDIENWMIHNNIFFKIIPMLNKDGVFFGNYRTGIVGDDFNRKFYSGDKHFFPQIYALKKLIKACKNNGKVSLFLDLHGHSVRKNCFFFGPDDSNFNNLKVSSFANELQQNSKYFNNKASVYKNQLQKIQTARVYFQYEQNILALTCQSSLGLYFNEHQTFQMMKEDWRAFGKDFINNLKSLLSQDQEDENKYAFIPRLSLTIHDRGISKIKKKQKTAFQKKMSQSYKNDEKPKESLNQNSKDEKAQKSQSNFYNKYQTQKKANKSLSKNKSKQLGSSFDKFKRTITPQSFIKNYLSTNLGQHDFVLTENKIITNDDKQLTDSLSPNDEQQILVDNFSENYISINDSDSSEEDLQQTKKNQLFEKIAEINRRMRKTETEDNRQKGLSFIASPVKEYHMEIEKAESRTELKLGNRLKPLKFQEFRMKGFANKKYFDETGYDFKNRFIVHQNGSLRKNSKVKKEDIERSEVKDSLTIKIKQLKLSLRQ